MSLIWFRVHHVKMKQPRVIQRPLSIKSPWAELEIWMTSIWSLSIATEIFFARHWEMVRVLWSIKLVRVRQRIDTYYSQWKTFEIFTGTQVLATMWASESNILVGMHDSSYSIWYCPGEASSDPTVIALTKVTSDITWENSIEFNSNSWS